MRKSLSLTLLLALLLCMTAFAADKPIGIVFAGSSNAEGLVFNYTIGGALPGTVTGQATSQYGSVPFEIVTSASWLQVSPTTGYTPASFSVGVNPSGLSAGTYTGTLTIRTSYIVNGKTVDASDTSTITLVVTSPPAVAITCPPATLAFTGTVGKSVPSKTINITSTGTLNYTVASNQNWVGAGNGVTNTPTPVLITPTGLTAGTHNGVLSINVPGANPSSCTVNVTLTEAPAIDIIDAPLPSQVTFNVKQGGAAPEAQTFLVRSGTSNAPFTRTSTDVPSWLNFTPVSGTLPQTFTVSVNPSDLTVGTHTYTVAYNFPTADPGVSTLRTVVTVNVAPQPAPVVTVSPQSLSFSYLAGATANPSPGSINVSAKVDGNASSTAFSASTNADWLTVTPTSTATPGGITVTPNLIGKPAGQLTGKVTVNVPAANPATYEVTVNATVSTVAVQVSPTGITASGTAGQPATGPQSVTLSTTATTPVGFTIAPAAAAPWLTFAPASGTLVAGTPVVINITSDATSLPAGTQSATLNVNIAGQAVATVPVTFQVAPAPPALAATPTTLNFAAVARGALTTGQTVALTTNPGMLAFTVTSSDAWIKVTPASGTGSGSISVQIDPKDLDPGKYTGTATIAGGSATLPITVSVDVVPPSAPNFTADPATLTFTKPSLQPGILRQTVTLKGLDSSITSNTLLAWNVSATTTAGGQWLAATQIDTATFPYTVKVYADAADIAPGTYSGSVKITATGSTTTTVNVPVTFTVTEPVRNSYTAAPAQIAPSHMFGENVKDLFGISLTPASDGLTYTAVAAGGNWLVIDGNPSGSMPATVRISTNSTGLAAGVYRGTITVTATAPQGVVITQAVQTVEVTLTVTAPPPPRLEASAMGSAHFNLDRNYPAQNALSKPVVQVRNAGFGSAQVSVVSDTPWLEFDGSTLTVGSTPVTLSAHVLLDRIPGGIGSFAGSYRLISNGSTFFTGIVSLRITAAEPQFDVRPVGSTFTAFSGYSQALTSTATVVNIGAVPFSFNVSDNAGWLSQSANSGTLQPGASQTITMAVATGLGAGTWQATAVFSASIGAATSQKTYNVAAVIRASGPPQVTPGNMILMTRPGPISQTYTISNPSGTPLPYRVSTGAYYTPYYYRTCVRTGWFGYSCYWNQGWRTMPAAVSSLGNNASGTIAAGGSVTITAAGTLGSAPAGSILYFNVGYYSMQRELMVYPSGSSAGKDLQAGTCDANDMVAQFTNLSGDSKVTAGLPTAIEAMFVDGCGAPLSTGHVSVEFANGDAPVMLQPTATAGVWTGTWIPANASAPQVEVSLIGENEDQSVGTMTKLTVGLEKSVGIPIVPANAVVNSGDYGTPMATAAGSYISIFGTSLAPGAAWPASGFPTTLSGTQVTLGDQALPLVFVSPTQINAFVPYNVAAGSTLPLQVVRSGGSSLSQPVNVEVRKPSLFVKDGSAARPGIVIAYRGGQSFVADAANPVVAGDVLELYTIGLGPVDQDLAPYKVSPQSPLARVKGQVKVTIGGKDAVVGFAGLSPDSLGLYQVNAVVPAGVAAGNQVPVVVTVEGVSTSPITVAVR